MANRNGTLSASTVASVTVAAERCEVLNRGPGEIWARIGSEDPTVGDQDTDVFCIPAGMGRVFYHDLPSGPKSQTVKLISSGTPAYSVTPL